MKGRLEPRNRIRIRSNQNRESISNNFAMKSFESLSKTLIMLDRDHISSFMLHVIERNRERRRGEGERRES